MERTVELVPGLWLVRLTWGQAYVWRDAEGLTLVDAGAAGSGPELAAALGALGLRREELRRIVLTHGHKDHAGGVAEVLSWGGETEVLAHAADAPAVRGERPLPPPVLAGWERPLFAAYSEPVPAAPPARVDRELADGDTVPFGGGARVLSAPGHTDGSVALHLPGHGVLFTGDLVANVGGDLRLGVFNTDTERAAESFAALAALDAETVCVGHGEPLTRGAGPRLREVAERLGG